MNQPRKNKQRRIEETAHDFAVAMPPLFNPDDKALKVFANAYFYGSDAAKKLATTMAVVVLGTGLTGNAVSSSDDAYVFRMRPWQVDDVAMILKNYRDSLNLVEGEETTQTVAEAIFANPKLGALASNARLAYFLVLAIARYSQYYTRFSWRSLLDELTDGLVMAVVHDYIASNAICRLSRKERRHVAASIFWALHKLMPPDTQPINLEGLTGKEIPIAESLLQFNCELVNEKLQLVDDEVFAYTVTPAIAIVLYAMLGVHTTPNPGWKLEEEAAALFAIQQWAIRCMEKYVSDGHRDELDRSLEQIRLLSLTEQVKSENASSNSKIFVPMVGTGAVLLNADRSPFADVIAPYMLIQARQDISSPTMTKTVKLYEEMEKCSLLKTSDRDTRVLRGLVEMWRGNLEPKPFQQPKESIRQQQQQRTCHNPQTSQAFPANLLCLGTYVDPVEYAVIKGDFIHIGGVQRPLPPLDGTKITFMISRTNVEKINLKLSSTTSIAITANQLDNDLMINEQQLSPSDQQEWRRFMQEQVREGVVVQFLLT